MHIVFVTSLVPPDGWGGIGTYVCTLAGELGKRGHDVTVISARRGERLVERCGNVTFIRTLDCSVETATTVAPQVTGEIARLLHAARVDVVEFHEIGAFGIDFQRAYPNVPTVIRLHGDSEHCLYGSIGTMKRLTLAGMSACRVLPKRLRLRFELERLTAAKASVVASPSAWMIADCRRRGWAFPRHSCVVPNPVEPARDLDLSPDRYTPLDVLWFGRLERLKGIDLLPSIARHVWQEVPSAVFHVIGQSGKRGDSTWIEWLARELPSANGRLVFHGGIDYSHVRKTIARYSIAAFASTREAFPYTLLECMAEGLACVSASSGGAREIGRPGCDVIQTARDAKAIASAVVGLLRDPKRRRTIGSAAAESVARKYSPGIIAQQMLSIYAKAVALSDTGASVV